MNLFLAVVIFMLSLAPASFSETLDKNNFLAPGSQKSDVQAPIDDAAKPPGVPNPASGPTVTGEKRPIAPTNGICPVTYHCKVMSDNTFLCMPNKDNYGLYGPESCSNIVRYCKNFRDALARGSTEIDDADRAKFAYYCG